MIASLYYSVKKTQLIKNPPYSEAMIKDVTDQGKGFAIFVKFSSKIIGVVQTNPDLPAHLFEIMDGKLTLSQNPLDETTAIIITLIFRKLTLENEEQLKELQDTHEAMVEKNHRVVHDILHRQWQKIEVFTLKTL